MTAFDLFGFPDRPGFKSKSTSRDAAIAAAGTAAALRQRIVSLLRSTRNLTADEIADTLGVSVLSIRPRVSELFHQGSIEPTGTRRPNKSGRDAHVWRIKAGGSA